MSLGWLCLNPAINKWKGQTGYSTVVSISFLPYSTDINLKKKKIKKKLRNTAKSLFENI